MTPTCASFAAYSAIPAAGARPRAAVVFAWSLDAMGVSPATEAKHTNQPARRLLRQPT